MPLKKHPNVLTIVFSVFLLLLVSAMPCAAQSTAYAIALGLDSCPGCFYSSYNGLQYQNSTEVPGGVTCTYPTPRINPVPNYNLPTVSFSAATGSTVTCSFSVLPGTYQVNLVYYDWVSTAANQRKFSVAINGSTVESAFDIYAYGSPQKSYFATVTGGTLSIVFTGVVSTAWVNAISIKRTADIPPSASNTISSCGSTISSSGSYIIPYGTMLSVADGNTPCIAITASNVSLDCQSGGISGTGHIASNTTVGIKVNTPSGSALSNVSIQNCKVTGVPYPIYAYTTTNLTVVGGTYDGLGSVAQGVSMLYFSDVSNPYVNNNTLNNAVLWFIGSYFGSAVGGYIHDNAISLSTAGQNASFSAVGWDQPTGIGVKNIKNINVAGNTISAPAMSSLPGQQADSAISLGDTDTAFVTNNTISGGFFTCIELTGVNRSPQILYNSCTATAGASACIEETYSSSLGRGVYKINGALYSPQITGNVCYGYSALARIACSNAGPTDVVFYLTDLLISKNTLKSPLYNSASLQLGDTYAYGGLMGSVGSAPCPATVSIARNTIQGNILLGLPKTSYFSAPAISPATAFTDGGGNYCWDKYYYENQTVQHSIPDGFPLTCLNYPPAAPVLAASSATGAITLNWSIPTSTYPLSSFTIHRTGGSGPQTFVVSSSTITYYRDTAVDNGTTYNYTITAADANGLVSNASNSVSGQSSNVCSYTGTALHGCYYNDGSFNSLGLQQTDPAINFTWGNGSPATGINNLASGYSVKWLTSPTFVDGTLRFNYTFTGLLGVSVDGNIVFLRTSTSPLTAVSDVTVSAGSHDIVVQYVPDAGGIGRVSLNWNQ